MCVHVCSFVFMYVYINICMCECVHLYPQEVKEQEQLLQKLEARVKDLQQFVEKSLSELYNGREVNLIGEINNLSTPSAQSVASSSSGREHSSEE